MCCAQTQCLPASAARIFPLCGAAMPAAVFPGFFPLPNDPRSLPDRRSGCLHLRGQILPSPCLHALFLALPFLPPLWQNPGFALWRRPRHFFLFHLPVLKMQALLPGSAAPALPEILPALSAGPRLSAARPAGPRLPAVHPVGPHPPAERDVRQAARMFFALSQTTLKQASPAPLFPLPCLLFHIPASALLQNIPGTGNRYAAGEEHFLRPEKEKKFSVLCSRSAFWPLPALFPENRSVRQTPLPDN